MTIIIILIVKDTLGVSFIKMGFTIWLSDNVLLQQISLKRVKTIRVWTFLPYRTKYYKHKILSKIGTWQDFFFFAAVRHPWRSTRWEFRSTRTLPLPAARARTTAAEDQRSDSTCSDRAKITWEEEGRNNYFKKIFFWCDLPLLAVFIIFVLFCHQVVHLIHLVFKRIWEMNLHLRTMAQTVSPWLGRNNC